jgi:formylglycine-generating enzyme required for sulfatase activity
VIPGGTFSMGRGPGTDACPNGVTCDAYETPEHSVTVSLFALDTFEVTVGRFRKFVNAFDGTPPSAGAGAHPKIPGSGWMNTWNTSLASTSGTRAALTASVKCDQKQTWTDSIGAYEQMPINCVDWYEAFAFCAWDGGFLPTEAEWEFAAAGGDENRLHPWDGTRGNTTFSAASPFVKVGSYPAGNARWGERDMAGSMWEWALDLLDPNWYAGAGSSCNDCADLSSGAIGRAWRGGAYINGAVDPDDLLRAVARNHAVETYRVPYLGFRCARRP